MVPFSHLHIGGTEIRGVQIPPDVKEIELGLARSKHGYPNVVFAWRTCVSRRKK